MNFNLQTFTKKLIISIKKTVKESRSPIHNAPFGIFKDEIGRFCSPQYFFLSLNIWTFVNFEAK